MASPATDAQATRAHLFKRDGAGLYCLSRDQDGRSLPAQPGGGGWRYVRPVELHPKEVRLALDSDAAIADLRRLGYHVVHGWYHQP